MCINKEVMDEGSRETVDAKCRKLTASWVRERHSKNPEVPVCTFFEDYENKGSEALLDPGVYTLSDLRDVGEEKGWCPYFLARHLIAFANVIVYNYQVRSQVRPDVLPAHWCRRWRLICLGSPHRTTQYMLDAKVAGMVSKELERECVVVFDEAHNIDNVCIESMSVNLRRQTLDDATRNIGHLASAIERVEASDAERLQEEYRRLVEGLQRQVGRDRNLSECIVRVSPGPVLPSHPYFVRIGSAGGAPGWGGPHGEPRPPRGRLARGSWKRPQGQGLRQVPRGDPLSGIRSLAPRQTPPRHLPRPQPLL